MYTVYLNGQIVGKGMTKREAVFLLGVYRGRTRRNKCALMKANHVYALTIDKTEWNR